MDSGPQAQEQVIASISEPVELSHTEFQAHAPYMGLSINALTVQQEKLVMLVASGMTVAAAGRAAGYASSQSASNAINKEQCQKALQYFREQQREKVEFTIANAHSMYMEAYTASANATEMKNTTDSLVKLHGLVQPDTATQVNVQVNASSKQLERLSDEELVKLVGKDDNYLEPVVGG